MNILITGSNRGIGLELVRQYAEQGWEVIATCRNPQEAEALQALAAESPRILIERLDVTSPEDIRAIQWLLDETPLDLLVNNAGIYLEKGYDTPLLGHVRYDDWLRSFEVNTLGAVRLSEALSANLAISDRRLIVAVTSHMGSIADIDLPGSFYYRSSKAALNAVMRGLAVELRHHGVGVLLLHPGGVRTRMGPSMGISVEESVRGMRNVIDRFQIRDTGCFLRYDGETLPW